MVPRRDQARACRAGLRWRATVHVPPSGRWRKQERKRGGEGYVRQKYRSQCGETRGGQSGEVMLGSTFIFLFFYFSISIYLFYFIFSLGRLRRGCGLDAFIHDGAAADGAEGRRAAEWRRLRPLINNRRHWEDRWRWQNGGRSSLRKLCSYLRAAEAAQRTRAAAVVSILTFKKTLQ